MRRSLAALALLVLAIPLLASSDHPAQPVTVGTAAGVRGQTVRGMLRVAESADGSPVALPVAVATGAKPGPVVWIEAAAHGDEYGGPRALQNVVQSLDPSRM